MLTSTKDAMTDASGNTFLLYAESIISDGLLHARPNLAIVCTTGHFNGALFDAGLVLSASTHESAKLSFFQTRQIDVTVRLDNKINRMSWDTMSDAKGLTIGKRDLEKIIKAKDARIAFPTFMGGYPVAVFQPAGLDRNTLSRSCGLKF